MLLKDREIDILTTVSHLRFMTTQQIHAIHGYSGKHGDNVTRRLLKQLVDNGLLKSWQPDKYSSKIFYLTKAGAKEVEFYHGYDNVRTFQKSNQTLHHVLVTEAYVQLRRADGGKVRRFAIHAKVGEIEADSFVEYQMGKTIKLLFLEVDRATETLHAIKEKLDHYKAVYDAGGYQKKFGVFPTVCFITTTDARQRSLWRVLNTYPYRSKVVTEKELRTNPRDLIE